MKRVNDVRLNSNIPAMTAHSNLKAIQQRRVISMQRLSSGKRINSAADDAAGLAITQRMRNQISGTKVAMRNVQDAVSLIQTAEGTLNEQHVILNRIRDLTVQAANESYSENDKETIQIEIQELLNEMNRMTKSANFNTLPLFSNSANTDVSRSEFNFQIGPNSGDTFKVYISNLSVESLGLEGFDVSKAVHEKEMVDEEENSIENITFDELIDSIDRAVSLVSKERAYLGATQNVLGYQMNSLLNSYENLSEAKSRIEDVDMAEEIMQLTKDNILYQATLAMLAQANQMPELLLKLLPGN